MGTLARRVAQLEQRGGEQGAGMWGIRTVHWQRGTGPDAVRVGASDEYITEAEFFHRHPRGMLILRPYFGEGDPPAPGAA